MITELQLKQFPGSNLTCLRCETNMRDAGQIKLHEGSRTDALGVLGGFGDLAGALSVDRLELNVLICPKCGKTEFFF